MGSAMLPINILCKKIIIKHHNYEAVIQHLINVPRTALSLIQSQAKVRSIVGSVVFNARYKKIYHKIYGAIQRCYLICNTTTQLGLKNLHNMKATQRQSIYKQHKSTHHFLEIHTGDPFTLSTITRRYGDTVRLCGHMPANHIHINAFASKAT